MRWSGFRRVGSASGWFKSTGIDSALPESPASPLAASRAFRRCSGAEVFATLRPAHTLCHFALGRVAATEPLEARSGLPAYLSLLFAETVPGFRPQSGATWISCNHRRSTVTIAGLFDRLAHVIATESINKDFVNCLNLEVL